MIDDDRRGDDEAIHQLARELVRSYRRTVVRATLALAGAIGAVALGATLLWLLLT